MAHVRQARGGYTANITHSENCYIHSKIRRIARLNVPTLATARCEKPGDFVRRLVPKLAAILPTDVFQKGFVVVYGVLPPSCHRLIKGQVIRMNVDQRHPAVLSNPIQFSPP